MIEIRGIVITFVKFLIFITIVGILILMVGLTVGSTVDKPIAYYKKMMSKYQVDYINEKKKSLALANELINCRKGE